MEIAKEFAYLGKRIPNNIKVVSTQLQASRTTAKFNELRSVLVNMATRKKLLKACEITADIWSTSMASKGGRDEKLEVCWF